MFNTTHASLAWDWSQHGQWGLLRSAELNLAVPFLSLPPLLQQYTLTGGVPVPVSASPLCQVQVHY